jgi:hypothetical protein
MSSFELLELFGASIVDPQLRTFVAHVWSPNEERRLLREITIPVDEAGMFIEKPERTIRVEFAPEDGVLAAALRGDERPEWKQMLAQTANSLAMLRVAYVPDADADEYGERLFLPVERQRELADDEAALQVEQQLIRDEGPDSGGLGSLWTQEVS